MEIQPSIFDDEYPFEVVLVYNWDEEFLRLIRGERKKHIVHHPLIDVCLAPELKPWMEETYDNEQYRFIYFPYWIVRFKSLADAFVFKCHWS